MNCMVCSKTKTEYDVWTNKIVIGALYDSEFQNHKIVRDMTPQSVICHECMDKIQQEVDEERIQRKQC